MVAHMRANGPLFTFPDDVCARSGITLQFEVGTPTLLATLPNGMSVRVVIPFEYDAKVS